MWCDTKVYVDHRNIPTKSHNSFKHSMNGQQWNHDIIHVKQMKIRQESVYYKDKQCKIEYVVKPGKKMHETFMKRINFVEQVIVHNLEVFGFYNLKIMLRIYSCYIIWNVFTTKKTQNFCVFLNFMGFLSFLWNSF